MEEYSIIAEAWDLWYRVKKSKKEKYVKFCEIKEFTQSEISLIHDSYNHLHLVKLVEWMDNEKKIIDNPKTGWLSRWCHKSKLAEHLEDYNDLMESMKKTDKSS